MLESRARMGTACGKLACCYSSMGLYGKAIMALLEEDKKIAEEVGDRAEVMRACKRLCDCHAQEV